MKCYTTSIAAVAAAIYCWVSFGVSSSDAFTAASASRQKSYASSSSSSSSASATSLSAASRRDILAAGMASILGIATAAASTVSSPNPAFAEARPMYLTEPTDEFKANEAKAMEFKRQQLLIKKEFTTALENLLAEGNDADALVKDLNTLQGLVAKTGGLPLGIKKEELFKMIRSKKAKGFWPTPVEIAYQSLIQEISFQQSPNLDKEMGNPYQ
jgi:hypothetical protein